MKKYEGEFTYKENLIALDGTTLERSEMTNDLIVNLTALGLVPGRDEMTGLRYVSLGEATAVLSYSYLIAYVPQSARKKLDEKSNEDMLKNLRFKLRGSVFVYEDGSMELRTRMASSKVKELVERGEAALALLMAEDKLPEEWDYWYPCYEEPYGDLLRRRSPSPAMESLVSSRIRQRHRNASELLLRPFMKLLTVLVE